ncbi:MAG TPA: hypothetical protein DHV48_13680 [Prolixibacteraceae bacterium]|nr:hypothetical protein [Prolixibacteraceae bacterium]
MLASPETDSIRFEKNLSEAYQSFAQSVEKVCTENVTGIPAFFSLNYVRIEFVQMLKQKFSDKIEINLLTDSYLNKGIQIIDCALEWLDKNIDQKEVINKKNLSPSLRWTGKTVDLIELAMSVHESGSVNNGDITVKAVVNFFCESFGVNPGNFSASYGVMRTRANSRTLFLDKLKRILEKKMERDDEKELRRKGIRQNSQTK